MTSIGVSVAASGHRRQCPVALSGGALWACVLDQLRNYAHVMLSEGLIEEAAHRFALLADPTRLRILRALMLDAELSVSDVARASGTSRYNASAHLNRLALGGLVARRQAGTTHYYRLADDGLVRVCDWVCEAVRTRALAVVSQDGRAAPPTSAETLDRAADHRFGPTG